MKSRVTLILQDECYKHRYIRSKDVTWIVERPERLRALKVGFAAAIARLEEDKSQLHEKKDDVSDELARALDQLSIAANPAAGITNICEIVRLPVTLQFLSSDAAVRMVHAANATGDGYDNMEHLDRLAKWARESEDKIKQGECEIPEGFPQNDLYMCPQSYSAICGAVEAIRTAVDTVMQAEEDGARTAFAAIRPPGHHCGEDTPSGFCFMNNVAIGAAHAHLRHGVKRVIIFDIDLHHGNGTQAIAWAINAETHRRKLTVPFQLTTESKIESTVGLQIFYASLHDILSFPCEEGNPELVRDASVSVAAHGQFIENMHLEPYSTHEEFWTDLYPRYQGLFAKAKKFLQIDPQDRNVPVFISCGFDASELEYESMSRHGRKVPPGFYYRFAKDTREFARKHATGRVVSVLEGGYSDRALIAGGLAHLVGLVEHEERSIQSGPEIWWSEKNLEQLEKATKVQKGKQSVGAATERWVERSVEILAAIDPPQPRSSTYDVSRKLPGVAFPSSMHLRDRKKGRTSDPGAARSVVGAGLIIDNNVALASAGHLNQRSEARTSALDGNGMTPQPPPFAHESTSPKVPGERKLPRLILRVREPVNEA